ncbi:MAG: hypothetical protein EPN30_08190 [Actinomycetota bacterium]|nr:MAG: hypothetical protein EPN30_08190 [Actinomycetota bacterium]
MPNKPFRRYGHLWLVAGVIAFFCAYIAWNDFGVSAGNQVSSIVQTVSIMSTPLSSALNQGLNPNGNGTPKSQGKDNKLIEISSNSPVLNYSQDESRLTEVKSSDDSTTEAGSVSAPVNTPTSAASAPESEKRGSQPVAASGSGDGCINCETVTTQQTSAEGQTSAVSTTSTSTTIARSDGDSSTAGDD